MAIYHRPALLEDALGFLDQTRATIAAGCTDLYAATDRPALNGPVLDLTNIVALKGIGEADAHFRIGAAASWADVIRADLPTGFDMLKQAAREVGSVQIQNAATVVGNICNASPAADGVPVLLALDAEVEIASRNRVRCVPLDLFITGLRQTVLDPKEIVTAILIPKQSGTGRSCFLKLGARKYLVISIAMVAARLSVENGMITHAALAVGACSVVATRLPRLEAALIGQPVEASAAIVTEALVSPEISPIDDLRADAPYRHHAAVELLRRALHDLFSDTKGQAV